MNFFWKIAAFLFRQALSLRYRIEIRGLDKITEKLREEKGGFLFLPNHVAMMDPTVLFAFFWPKFSIRPIVIETIYQLPYLRLFMRIVKGVPVPDLTRASNQLRVHNAKKAIQAVIEGLHRKENFIVYPSGKLKLGPKEDLSGSSGAHEIAQYVPEAKIVLIRSSGFWGSSFSRAITGESPDIFKTLLKGLYFLCKNGLFFMPRRKITIDLEFAPQQLKRAVSRVEFNRVLENWYNRYEGLDGKIHEEEPLQLVPYSFFTKKLPEVASVKPKESISKASIPIRPETAEAISKELRKLLRAPNLEISENLRLSQDLGMDSLNVAEIIAFLAKKFDVTEIHPDDLKTVRDLFEVAELAQAQPSSKTAKGTLQFPKESKRLAIGFLDHSNIPKAFLFSCAKRKNHIACADDASGVFSYAKFKKAALVLAMHFQKIPESRVAVLLPASAGAYLVIFALMLAKKTPVMLNWTLGPRYLEEMMKISEAKRVISSLRFIDRISHVDLGSLCDQIEVLEDIRGKLSLKTKLKGVVLSLLPASIASASLQLNSIPSDSEAVILFTSGTEAVPKGVPLTHKNILSNQMGVLESIKLEPDDIIFGILPPFHSFGFSLPGILPILVGMRVAYFPDPTDGFALAEGVERWGITLFCGAPNFIKNLLYTAKIPQLASVRLFASGAEKAPEQIYEFVRTHTKAKLLEGYGITECAPVISMQRANLPQTGVGYLLSDVEARTIHLETQEPLEQGKEGELCFFGPNVFRGYLGKQKSPFIEIDGKEWYRSGDIGYVTEDQCVVLSGRIKRFTKLGGEMISLGAIEDTLTCGLKRIDAVKQDAPSLAVCAKEAANETPEIVVFTTSNKLTAAIANQILHEAGFSRLIKVARVEKIEEIPLLGTGKTHYRRLQTLIS